MRSTLALLLLVGPAIVTATTCELYKLPKEYDCEIEIEWRVHNDKQALATCLEYFPTTFVKGVQSGDKKDKVKCTVTSFYKCVDENHFMMYDKCYYFSPTPNAVNKQMISEYVKMDATTKRSTQCAGGKLAAVYSSTHAKFLGMEANRRGIDKLGIGMTTDGMTIDEENGKKSMLHKNMWKLVEGDYWNGDKLVKVSGKNYPATSKYLFMRTQTDHMFNRMQGSFERATADVVVTFACEVPAIFTRDQFWYCDKLGSKGLGLDTVYLSGTDFWRSYSCLYVTASKYTYKGTYENMVNIKGCQEYPSDLHSTSLDDGAAFYPGDVLQFRNKGPLRLAGYKDPNAYNSDSGYFNQKRCQKTPDESDLNKARQQWKYFLHNGNVKHSPAPRLEWEENYPKNECSDFPGDSITLGLKNGKKIDLPAEVRAHAVCSIIAFHACEHSMAVHKKSLCGDELSPRDHKPMRECKSRESYQEETKGFYTCSCPEGYSSTWTNERVTGCKWSTSRYYDYGAKLEFGYNKNIFVGKNEKRNLELSGIWDQERYNMAAPLPPFGPVGSNTWDNLLDKVSVRDGCRLTVWGAPLGVEPNFKLLDGVGYGTHHVPNAGDGSLDESARELGASAVECWCPDDVDE